MKRQRWRIQKREQKAYTEKMRSYTRDLREKREMVEGISEETEADNFPELLKDINI